MIEFKEVQSRLKSKVAWVAIFALILFVIKNYLGYEIPKLDELYTLIMGVLVAIGIFNNPTDAEKY